MVKVWQLISDGRDEDARFVHDRVQEILIRLNGAKDRDILIALCSILADKVKDSGFSVYHCDTILREFVEGETFQQEKLKVN